MAPTRRFEVKRESGATDQRGRAVISGPVELRRAMCEVLGQSVEVAQRHIEHDHAEPEVLGEVESRCSVSEWQHRCEQCCEQHREEE